MSVEMTMAEFIDRVDQIIGETDFGRPSAAKRGRNADYPWVPVIVETINGERRTTNPAKGLAFSTREEAVACAESRILGSFQHLRRRLMSPTHRAEREFRGLPRELPKDES